MNIRQIEVFHAVMTNSTASRAAEVLRISQPAVSKAIQELERDIGFALFRRERGRMFPTAEANIFFKEVESSFSGLTRLKSAAARIRDFGSGEIKVASLSALSTNILPRALRGFQARHPNVAIAFQAQLSSTVKDLVASGQVDVGLAADEIETEGVDVRPFARYRAAIAVPDGHRLENAKELTPEDLDGEAFIALSPEDTTRRAAEAIFRDRSAKLKVVLETPYSTTICAMVQAGLGIGLVNPMTAEPYIGRGLTIIPFKPAIYFRTLLVLPPNRYPSRIVADFVEEVMKLSVFQ
ncbi:LysR substrate-binding domain-containing protein [Rhizobium sp. RU36D]|uniref:LysR substrate-binding domain-containing protein n=1 Tax=Rhizobium sp. RU36D TaxID=1907415 RepID=UPI0009D7C06B|nr:LysR substrate-binding domain-containing protein [Rhizobium sp. RU36D]SMC93951.1 transcriptional regulator, LysR family [Rhizobium sp. RU36D]